MTTPGNFIPPNTSYVIGGGEYRYGQDYTEQTAKQIMKSGPLGSFGRAQENMHAYMAGVGREVTRLDNRIDELVIGNELVHIATFSESGIWTKPPGASRLVVAAIGPASGGGHGNNPSSASDSAGGGLGGYSGGWGRRTLQAVDVPDTVAVTVSAGSPGATAVGAAPAAGPSSFGDLVVGTGSTGGNYGTGDYAFRVRGGNGAYATGSRLMGWQMVGATYGGEGSFSPGGEAGVPLLSANPGNNGYSITEVGKVGMGSGGGGGAFNNGGGAGGRGGDGGWPSGPGGGGGGSNLGVSGNGGNGGGGVVIVMTYREDTLGVAPSVPTGLAASAINAQGATITWAASTDDIAVRRYAVLVNGTEVASADGLTHTLAGLNPSTTYSVTVQAVDLGGNKSAESSPLSFTTTAM